jgi:hypothetical protein
VKHLQPLRRDYMDRLFFKLHGLYGQDFVRKYSLGRIENNEDVGITNAREVWAEELAGFHDQPEAIAYALQHVDPKHVPNAPEFRELCRQGARKADDKPALPALERKFTPEELEANKARIRRMVQGLEAQTRMQGT